MTIGKNMSKILQICSTSFQQISPEMVKRKMKYWNPNEDQQQRIGMAIELLGARDNQYVIDGFSSEEIEELLKYVCTN